MRIPQFVLCTYKFSASAVKNNHNINIETHKSERKTFPLTTHKHENQFNQQTERGSGVEVGK